MDNDQTLRQQLVNLLVKRQAHMTFEDAVANFPEEHINTRPPNLGYSFWHLVDHIRFCQWDILDYIRNPDYASTEWPIGYWPDPDSDTNLAGWNTTIKQFYQDRQVLIDIVQNPDTDLYAQIPHGAPDHNILREILVVGQHNAYHSGELCGLRGNMGLWPGK